MLDKTLIWKQQNTHRTRKNSTVWLNKKNFPYSKKMWSVTTVVTKQFKQQLTASSWVPNTQQSVATVTSRWSDTSSEDPRQFQHWNHAYAFPTRLGWCQTLEKLRMDWLLQKGRAKVTPLWAIPWLWVSASPSCDTGKRQSQHMPFLGPCPHKSWHYSWFSN